MKTETFGELRCVVTGGEDREGNGDVVVLLHGFGAPGEDLVPLWRVLGVPRGTRFVFPSAPLELSYAYGMGDARAWWMIDLAALDAAIRQGTFRELGKDVPVGLDTARAAVIGMLEAIDARMRPSSLVLGGFSQGAMLALDVALHTDRPLAGLVLLSGTLLAETLWSPRMPSRKGTPVLQSHGTHDPLLPYAVAEKLRDHMSEAGLDVEFVGFRGQHEIPPIVLDRASAFLRRVLAEGGDDAHRAPG
jgi:phospholipase/carboxylesterase